MSNKQGDARSVTLDRSKLLGFDQLPPRSDGSLPRPSGLAKVGAKRPRRSPATPQSTD
jgi:hypothetical protein